MLTVDQGHHEVAFRGPSRQGCVPWAGSPSAWMIVELKKYELLLNGVHVMKVADGYDRISGSLHRPVCLTSIDDGFLSRCHHPH